MARHAKDIKSGDLKIGDSFVYEKITVNGSVEAIGIVTDIKKTKTGRLNIFINDREWANGAISPASLMQS